MKGTKGRDEGRRREGQREGDEGKGRKMVLTVIDSLPAFQLILHIKKLYTCKYSHRFVFPHSFLQTL